MKGKRRFFPLLTTSSFVVLAATGILAFVRPFTIRIVGRHSLMGWLLQMAAFSSARIAAAFTVSLRHILDKTSSLETNL